MADDKRKSEQGAPKAPLEVVVEKTGTETYVLTKNFGAIVNGRSFHWPKGTEFVVPEDADEVTLLCQRGAPLKLKV
ncbi:MAG TPA: hypothetical protein VMZ31_05875 [Phycisphaerae bacterium]|nr:hypothetical protein [Phycisphaerae bacterium]